MLNLLLEVNIKINVIYVNPYKKQILGSKKKLLVIEIIFLSIIKFLF